MQLMAPQHPIYLDCQATTPLDPEVLDAMLPYFREQFGNPHVDAHAFGRAAASAVESARAEVAELINADSREIVFTSGATESNNLAIKGAARYRRERHGLDHVVTVATEHKCVLESFARLEREGFRSTVLPVEPSGLVDLKCVEAVLEAGVALVSVMAANNEIGTVQPLQEVGSLCRERSVVLHTDAAQAAGKIPFDVQALGVDLVSLSGHKLYGPKGVGALYVRRRPRVRIEPLFDGGGQERTLRSGTVPVPLVVGLGVAARIARQRLAEEAEHTRMLRDRMLSRLRVRHPDVVVHGEMDARLPGNLSVGYAGIQAHRLVRELGDVALSTGSACSDTSVETSYVLRALGVSEALAAGTFRISPGRFTTEAEIDRAAVAIADGVDALRAQCA
ncbi:MAG: aminotransferase class V-fold PLP-dependent enzyme [Rhodospirillales bacterium]|nr:aminotransferase class V-fold PLP-dependent enzyme [Rhodospirillales bacterium]